MWAYTVGFTVLPHIGATLGWFLHQHDVPAWYDKLKKPSWCPASRMFTLAWAVLYAGMGYASYLVWRDLGGCSSRAIVPLGLYGAQLALSWLWPAFFFGARNPIMALITIVCVDGLAIGTLCSWYRLNRLAALLLAPYVAWLAVATCLTFRVWRDNRGHKAGKGE